MEILLAIAFWLIHCPGDLLKNIDALLNVPDAEFLKYSAEDRKQLVARFALEDYGTNFAAINIPMKLLSTRSTSELSPAPSSLNVLTKARRVR
jgi:hypothetical protein